MVKSDVYKTAIENGIKIFQLDRVIDFEFGEGVDFKFKYFHRTSLPEDVTHNGSFWIFRNESREISPTLIRVRNYAGKPGKETSTRFRETENSTITKSMTSSSTHWLTKRAEKSRRSEPDPISRILSLLFPLRAELVLLLLFPLFSPFPPFSSPDTFSSFWSIMNGSLRCAISWRMDPRN